MNVYANLLNKVFGESNEIILHKKMLTEAKINCTPIDFEKVWKKNEYQNDDNQTEYSWCYTVADKKEFLINRDADHNFRLMFMLNGDCEYCSDAYSDRNEPFLWAVYHYILNKIQEN